MRSALNIVIITLSACLVLSGCWDQGHADASDGAYLHLAQTITARKEESYPFRREYAGEVQAHQSSLLGFELSGQVSRLFVNEGDPVVAGQLLASLDTRLLLARGDELEARKRELSTELALARRNLERVTRLRKDNLASEREQDELQSRTEVLSAGVQRIQAELAANSIRLQQSELRAPFDARIASREVDSGAVVAAGTPVLRLVESARREVRVGLPVTVAEQMRRGDRIQVRVNDQWFSGPVLAIGPAVDQATRSRAVRIGIDQDWSPGALAYVGIDEPVRQNGFWLPDTAVTEGLRGTWVAYIAVDNGDGQYRIEARSVQIHHVHRSRLYVSGALGDGELVLMAGLHRYAPGQVIRVVNNEWIADARQES